MGQRKFIALHILVPGTWTVQQGHNALEKIESDIRNHFQGPVTVFTHLEPVKGLLSMDDIGIERVERKQKIFYRFINSGPVIQKGNPEDTLSFLLGFRRFGGEEIR